MNNNVAIGLVLLVLVLGGYYFMNTSKPVSETTPTTIEEPTTMMEEKQAFVADKTFDVKGLNYTYDVKEIKVKLNDKVKVNFTNTEGMHDFKIDELGVDSKVIQAGEMASVEFVASKAGTFDYYCSVGQHRANGMWGKIVVEE